MRMRCYIGLHSWGMYSEPVTEPWGQFIRDSGVKVADFVKVAQVRRCQDCRKTVRREIESGVT